MQDATLTPETDKTATPQVRQNATVGQNATPNPMEELFLLRAKGMQPQRCKAHSKQRGTQCARMAIPGGTVCRYHGGAAPAVIARAKRRLRALVDPALGALESIVSDGDVRTTASRLGAAKDILDRAGLGAKQQVEVHSQTDVTLTVVRALPTEQLEQMAAWLAEARQKALGSQETDTPQE